MRAFIFSTFILASVSLAFTKVAQADIIRCTFTEPFLTYTYSMAQQKLTVQDHGTGRTTSYSNTAFQILAAGRFVVGDVARPRLVLLLNNRGSDGMSDLIYPYTGIAKQYSGDRRDLNGGCRSNYLRPRCPAGGACADEEGE
jgi:hypothetical protein